MKRLILIASLGLASVSYAQQDVAVVVSHQPRYVTVQQRQCGTQEVVRQNDTTGGTIIGGVAGAAIGSTIGHNRRDSLVGTVVGGLVGGAIGNEVAKGPATVEQRQVCSYVPVTVQQGEVVTFQYQGRTFSYAFP